VRANRSTSRKNSVASETVNPTGGQVLADGTVIDLVEDLSQPGGLSLLKWNRHRATTSPRIVHAGKTYVPLPLEPSVRRALRLPSGCAPVGRRPSSSPNSWLSLRTLPI
jgi:hypothetical protein